MWFKLYQSYNYVWWISSLKGINFKLVQLHEFSRISVPLMHFRGPTITFLYGSNYATHLKHEHGIIFTTPVSGVTGKFIACYRNNQTRVRKNLSSHISRNWNVYASIKFLTSGISPSSQRESLDHDHINI